jgi:hypothetical protein
MKCFKDNDWNENLGVEQFLELEKQIYLDMFPLNIAIFDEEEEEDTEEDSMLKTKEKVCTTSQKRSVSHLRVHSSLN